jgi:hypothetical protein
MRGLCAALVILQAFADVGSTPIWWVDPITVKVMHQQQQPYPSSRKEINVAGQRGECERVQIWSSADQARTDTTLAFSELHSISAFSELSVLSPSVWTFKQQGYVYANTSTHYQCSEDILTPGHPFHPKNMSTMCADTPARACTTGCPADPKGICGGGSAPPGSCNMCKCNQDGTTCGGAQPCATCHPCLSGWYPDPLLDVPPSGIPLIPPHFTQPIFLEVCIPYGSTPGNYSGTVVMASDATSSVTIPVKLEVWPIDLPMLNDTSSFNTAFRFGSDMSKYYPAGTPPSQQWDDWMPFLAHHRIPADDIYLNTPRPTKEYQALAATGAKWMNMLDAGIETSPLPPGYVQKTIGKLAPLVTNMSALGLLDKMYV